MEKTTILVVEDEEIVAMDLVGKLGLLGYEVVGQAAGGEEAIELACRLQPQIVLMDIWLKGRMDGIEAAEAIRSQVDLPVIYLTAHSDSATLERAKQSGPFGYILKPFEERELSAAIEMALYRHRSDRQLREQGEALRESQALLNALIENTSDPVYVKDSQGRILMCNPALGKVAGKPVTEIIGRTDSEYFGDPTIGETLRVNDLRVMEGGSSQSMEETVMTPDGYRIFLSNKAPYRKESGEIIGIVGISHDITARKQAEDSLKKLNEGLEYLVAQRTAELREKDQILLLQSRQAAMGEMIGNIAHQWRQPLNALGLTVQQLWLYYDIGEFTREFLDKSVSQSLELIRHMSKTIDDFRNYFRPDKEKVEFKVSEAIAHTVSLIEDGYKDRQIIIEVVAKGDPVIFGYKNEFAQALLNILNNARDAIIEQEINNPRVTIEICNSEDGCAVVTIADNAGGIPEGIISKIFDPYFTTKGPQHGTGVGLFMSKAIIEKNMGGRLVARNIADGAEFWVKV